MKKYYTSDIFNIILFCKKTNYKHVLFLLVFFFFNKSWSQNGTTCAQAISISINGACLSGSVSDATQNAPNIGTTCTAGTFRRERWYTFTVTDGPQNITITANTSDRNLYLQLISGTCGGTLTQIACANNDTANNSAQTEVINYAGLTNGTYYVKVSNVGSTSSNMDMTSLCIIGTADNCNNSIPLTVNSDSNCAVSTPGTTIGATQSQAGCVGTADDDVWYSFVATATNHTVTVTQGTLSDAVLQVFSGSCGSLNSLVCEDSYSNWGEEAFLTGLTIGHTYYVRVYSYGNTNGTRGTFNICVTVPFNDNCNTSIPLTVNSSTTCTTSTSGTTIGATQSQNGCSGNADDDVWYNFTAIDNIHIITVTHTAGWTLRNAVFQVFSGSCGSLNNLGCINNDNNNNGIETTTLTGLTIGNTYYIRVYSQGGNNNDRGTFSICITTPNDNCLGAETLTVNTTPICTTSTSGTTVGATQSTPTTGSCANNNSNEDDVWYKFIATNTSHTITVTRTNINNPVFEVFSGNCNSLSLIACVNDNSGNNSNESRTITGLIPGNEYFVRVYSFANGSGRGTFNICITTPLENDECSNSITLTVNNSNTCSTSTNGTTAGATQSQAGCTGTADDDVWYNFTAISTAHTITVTHTTGWTLSNAVFEVFSGSCGSLNSIVCRNGNNTANSTETVTLSALTIGNTYFVRVYSQANGSGQGTFSICVTTPPIPSNDECSSAIPLTVSANSTCTNTLGTTVDATQSLSGCSGSADDDVWYSFTALGSSHVITVTRVTLTNPVFEVFAGNCNSLTSIACINDTGDAGNETTNLIGLTPGVTYYVRVYSAGSSRGTFNICITTCSGNGIGNSTAGCPTIDAGGLGLNGANPAPINLCNGLASVNLEANFMALGNTSNYTVSSIPYANLPYQYGCLANTVNIGIDDRWSNAINIPFSSSFCFYGNTYNSFVIGSNGMISFNAALANGATGYYIGDNNNNIPTNVNASNGSTNYFYGPSIFGVHHDIDPSIGGEIGWELITLQSGCRALVIAWNNVPMYYTNSRLYTGMIVLYETTNIVEVYIKEKRLDPSGTNTYWNNGNAVVGLQNNATQGIAAPGRNATDGDPGWTATNEAWRFTPSGTSIASIAWYEGSGTSGNIVGTSNTIAVSPRETTTYTAAVTYNFCNGTTRTITDETTVTVTGGKVWNGSSNSNWNNSNNWTPNQIPNGSDCVIIPSTSNQPIISGTNYNGLAGTLRILDNAILTVNSANSLTVTDWININTNGTFLINNTASLIQINNVTNTINGNFTYKRNAEIRKSDYVYWSSPVANFNVNSISAPIAPGLVYIWNTKINNPNGGQGNWVTPTTAQRVMTPGKGYIVKGPNSFNDSSTSTLYGSFTGAPNNGIITIPIHRGSDQNTNYHTGTNGTEITNLSDNWNLIGNPYPSSIRASQFLYDNRTKIEGNVRLWTHGTLPSTLVSSPFYSNFAANYDANDYLTYTFTGTSCCPAASDDLFIGAAQGFFVQMIDGSQTTDDSNFVTFSNSMRNASYPNNVFFRTANPQASPQEDTQTINVSNLERHRIWLDIVNSSNKSNRALFGYIEGATMGRDSFYDCLTQNTGTLSIYSLIDDTKFLIQGRALPFDENDEVPIGITVPATGNYKIAVAGVDGIFDGTQDFYLKDNLLNTIHNIKEMPYQFNSVSGMINDRFKIVYRNASLGIDDIIKENDIKVISNENISVISKNHIMESVTVYNVLGQNIMSYEEINADKTTLLSLQKNNTTLILKIKLQDGQTVIRKVIY